MDYCRINTRWNRILKYSIDKFKTNVPENTPVFSYKTMVEDKLVSDGYMAILRINRYLKDSNNRYYSKSKER